MENKKKFKKGDLIEIFPWDSYFGIVIGEGEEYKYKNAVSGAMRSYVRVWTVDDKNYKIWAGDAEWDRTEVLSRGMKENV